MGGPAGPKQSAMCLLVVVVFQRMAKTTINCCTRWTIAGFIAIWALGDQSFTNNGQSSYKYPEKQENIPNVMTFTNDKHGDLGMDIVSATSV